MNIFATYQTGLLISMDFINQNQPQYHDIILKLIKLRRLIKIHPNRRTLSVKCV